MHAQKVIGQRNRRVSYKTGKKCYKSYNMLTSQQQKLGTKINTTHVENKIKQVSIT